MKLSDFSTYFSLHYQPGLIRMMIDNVVFTSVLGIGIAGLFFIYLMYSSVPISFLLGWYSILLFFLLFRSAVAKRLGSVVGLNEKKTKKLLKIAIYLSGGVGLTWGAASIMTLIYAPEYGFIVVAIIAGLITAAIGTLNAVFTMYLVFNLTTVIPTALSFFFYADSYNAFFAMMIIYDVIIVGGARKYHQIIRNSLLLKERVEELNLSLEGRVQELYDFNRMLEENIEHRTEELASLQERMELAFAGSNDGIWDWNMLTDKVYFSSRWKEMLGYEDYEIVNDFSEWEKRVDPDALDSIMSAVDSHAKRETDLYEETYRMKHKDGHWVWILDRAKMQYDESGRAIRMIGTHTDITEKKLSEQRLLWTKANLDEAQRIAHLGSWRWDMSDDSLYWSDEVFRIIGEMPQSFTPTYRLFISYIYREDRKKVKEALFNSIQNNTPCEINYRVICRNGTLHQVKGAGNVHIDKEGQPLFMVGTVLDITELKETEEELRQQKNIMEHLAYHDELTGLPNRSLFMDRLNQSIKKERREKNTTAVLFFDLDNFKSINDSFGHKFGDEILAKVADRLKQHMRETDTIARIGGDEFTMLIEGIRESDALTDIVQKLMHSMHEPFLVETQQLYITFSLGIALYPDDGEQAETLLKNADAAMYKAKDMGRNTYQFYRQQMTENAFERIVMETSLRQAVERKEFIVYYQPQVDARTDKLTGMEALIRWNHINVGLVSPEKFLHLAEETGMIIEMDRWIMMAGMKQVVHWRHKGFDTGILSFNLSMKNLERDDFTDTLKTMFETTKCLPEWIGLEVTEGQIMKNPELSIETLQFISKMGIAISVDDFGTGYSSLSYLKRLPIDKLKIDRSFIRDIPGDEDDVAIVKTIISLSKSMNMEAIAEGVEGEAQKEFLLEHGCDNIQGYLYGRPVSADEMEEVLKKYKR